MFNLENEISKAVLENSINLRKIEEEEKDEILTNIKNNFVVGNPRALWLSLKYKPESIQFTEEYPYLKLKDILASDEDYILLIDEDNEFFHTFIGRRDSIIKLIEECIGLDEYYIINSCYTIFICETDHDELLYINLNQNR